RLKSFTENRKAAFAYARERERYTRESYRAWFDAAIEDAAEGSFTLYGCAVNQYCYEDPLAGGYFTSALIEEAADWTDRARTDGCLVMPTALQLATSIVSARTMHYSPKQEPNGGPQNRTRGNNFPFAVALV